MESTPQHGRTDERRVHLELRAIFEDAYEIALPFLDPELGVGGISLEHHVYVVVHEAYPNLTQYELAVLVPALKRIFQDRSQSAVQ